MGGNGGRTAVQHKETKRNLKKHNCYPNTFLEDFENKTILVKKNNNNNNNL